MAADLKDCRLIGLHRLRKGIRERMNCGISNDWAQRQGHTTYITLTHAQRVAIWVGEALVDAGLSVDELTSLVGVLDAEVKGRLMLADRSEAARA